MTPQTFIFIGPSGSGKGTQAKLLQDYLASLPTPSPVFYVQTGEEFRHFVAGETYSQKLAAQINAVGGLQPEFLAIYMWSKLITENLKGNEHIIFDGTPRKLREAAVLDSVFTFYQRPKPIVFFMKVSDQEASHRLALRKRLDDTSDEIISRLKWYHTDVVPAIEWYRTNPNYVFVEINGEQTPEKIHQDIITHGFN